MLSWSAWAPTAVLARPVVLLSSALRPVAVLKKPVVLLKSALLPKAVLFAPVVLDSSAPVPPAVFPWASLGVGFGAPPQLSPTHSRKTRPATPPARRHTLFIPCSS